MSVLVGLNVGPFCLGSTLQDGYELPSRLAVSAANCFLSLSEALIRKAKVSSNKAKKRPVVSLDGGEKKAKPAPETLDASNMELDYILWDHLEEVYGLVQKLVAVSSILLHLFLPIFCILSLTCCRYV